MKKTVVLILISLMAVSGVFAQSVPEKKEEKTKLVVFAAASMTETMTRIKEMYESTHPGVEIIYNFDSSGTLKTQIEQGADCDLFISAAQKQMNELSNLGLIDTDTRVNLLENKTALAVPEGNPKGIKSFDRLADLLKNGTVLLAIGNSDVPVGQYTQKIFAYYGLDEKAISSKLTYGSNVKEVTTQVKNASVDCGIIYSTDAFSAGLTVVDVATEAMTGGRVVYPAAVLTNAKNAEAVKTFFEYIKSPEATKVFESVGFASAL